MTDSSLALNHNTLEVVETVFNKLIPQRITQAQRQCLIICLAVELGPNKPRLTHEADKNGLYYNLLTTVREQMPHEAEQRQVLAEVYLRLSREYIMGIRAEYIETVLT